MDISLGQILKAIRKDLKMSLRDVEKATGISNAYLSQIERGKRNAPTIRLLLKLAKAYGMKEEEMISLCISYHHPDEITTYRSASKKKTGAELLVHGPDTHCYNGPAYTVQPNSSFIVEKYERLSNEGKKQLKDFLLFLIEKEGNKLL